MCISENHNESFGVSFYAMSEHTYSAVLYLLFIFVTAGWINQLPSSFGVHKGDKDPITVTLPRELQGNSEVLVFLEPQPVKSENNNSFT